MQTRELTTQALRMADIEKMRGRMQGLGLSKEQEQIIEGAAIFNKQTGQFQVQVAGHMKNISQLTRDQADAFVKEGKSLEDRAKEAQTFDKAFQATINEFKSMLMPLLQDVNTVLKFIMTPVLILQGGGAGISPVLDTVVGTGLHPKVTGMRVNSQAYYCTEASFKPWRIPRKDYSVIRIGCSEAAERVLDPEESKEYFSDLPTERSFYL